MQVLEINILTKEEGAVDSVSHQTSRHYFDAGTFHRAYRMLRGIEAGQSLSGRKAMRIAPVLVHSQGSGPSRMRARSKPTVAIVHGLLDAGNGGSEARAIWAVEALKDDFAVSLVAPGFISLDRLTEAYGTAITREQVRVCSLPIPRILTHKRAPSALRGAFASRALRSVIHEHDILTGISFLTSQTPDS